MTDGAAASGTIESTGGKYKNIMGTYYAFLFDNIQNMKLDQDTKKDLLIETLIQAISHLTRQNLPSLVALSKSCKLKLRANTLKGIKKMKKRIVRLLQKHTMDIDILSWETIGKTPNITVYIKWRPQSKYGSSKVIYFYITKIIFVILFKFPHNS